MGGMSLKAGALALRAVMAAAEKAAGSQGRIAAPSSRS